MTVHAQRQAHAGSQVTANGTLLNSLFSMLLTITAIVAFVIALLASAVVAYGLYYQDQVYPGVQAIGVDIGGVSSSQAQAALDERTSTYLTRDIVLEYEGQSFVTTPETLGATFDNERTVERAYEFGRSGNWWADSRDWLDSLIFGHDVGVVASVEPVAVEAYLSSIANEVAIPPTTPTFQLNSDGQLEITQSSAGLGIDSTEVMSELRSEFSSLGEGPVQISTVTLDPAYDEEALAPMQERVSAILEDEFVMEYGDYQWALDAHLIDSVLVITTDPSTGETELTANTERLSRYIATVAAESGADGRDARVRWNGESYDVNPSVDGWTINVDDSVELVEAALLSGEHRVELATDPVEPAITTAAADRAADFGNDLVNSRFELTWDEGETDLGGSVIAAAMSFENNTDTGEIVHRVDVSELTRYLSSIKGNVDVEPVNADLRYFNGEVVVQSEESYGLEMDREASAQAIADAVEAGEDRAEITVNEAAPDVTAAMAGEIEIREMLSFGETYYGGSSANRAHNVEHATRLANGALVPPGGTYSFVDSIGGEISEETGYAPGFGIEAATDGGVTTVPSIGGGVCQVSTTVFQAAFWAGMPIVERNWHLYWMPIYGQDPSGMTGLDATIATTAGLDFKFENTTGDWIAIVASANGNANRFEIWGTDPGWNVETDGPHISNRVSASSETVVEESDEFAAGTRIQVESAHDGFDVEIRRWVYNNNGDEIDSLVLNSTYQPASNRVLVGTGN